MIDPASQVGVPRLQDGDAVRPPAAQLDDARLEQILSRALWVLGVLWVGAQFHRLLLPALLGASPILRDFGITAGEAGLLASIYFPVYGLSQIMSGMIADRGGLRRLLVSSALLLGVFGVGFALAPSVPIAVVFRALLAVASSLFWVPSVKLVLRLSRRHFGRSVAIMVGLGSIGGLAALVLLPWVLQLLPWRTVSLIAALVMFPIAAAMLLLPEPPEDRGPAPLPLGEQVQALVATLGDLRVWRFAWPAMMWDGMWFGMLTWLPRFARDVLHIAPAESGVFAAALTLALIPGSYLFGLMASRRPATIDPLFFVAQIVTLVLVLAMPWASGSFVAVLLLTLGLGVVFGGFFLYNSMLASIVPAQRLGAATGVVSCLTFLPAFVSPWLMGWALDYVDKPTSPDPVYSLAAFGACWLVAAGFVALGLLGVLVMAPWRAGRRRAT